MSESVFLGRVLTCIHTHTRTTPDCVHDYGDNLWGVSSVVCGPEENRGLPRVKRS